ncbi:MAG: hypothetical protein WCF99_08735 [Chloroflexales bacterium]
MNNTNRFDGPYNAWSEQCFYCRWYQGFNIETMARICKAFPEGIPLAFWNDQERHDQPFPGDNGFQFAPFTPDEIEVRQTQAQVSLTELRKNYAKLPPELYDPTLFTEDELE